MSEIAEELIRSRARETTLQESYDGYITMGRDIALGQIQKEVQEGLRDEGGMTEEEKRKYLEFLETALQSTPVDSVPGNGMMPSEVRSETAPVKVVDELDQFREDMGRGISGGGVTTQEEVAPEPSIEEEPSKSPDRVIAPVQRGVRRRIQPKRGNG